MKKKDILKLLEYRKNAIESKLGKRNNSLDMLDNPLRGLYPDIEELKKEFSIINNEFNKLKEKRRKNEEYIKKNEEEIKKIKCDHPILLGIDNCINVRYHCAFCHKDTNETKNRVLLLRYDYDFENTSYYQLTNYNEQRDEFYRLYNIINSMIMNNEDDDEIDFTNLFNASYEKYNIGEIKIDKTYEKIIIKRKERKK